MADSINQVKSSAYSGYSNVGPIIKSSDPGDNSPTGSGGPSVGPHFYPSPPSYGSFNSLDGSGPSPESLAGVSDLWHGGLRSLYGADKNMLDFFVNGPKNTILHPGDFIQEWKRILNIGGSSTPGPTGNPAGDIGKVGNAVKTGKNNKTAPAPGSSSDPNQVAYQKALYALYKNLGYANNGKNFDVPYTSVTPTHVQAQYQQNPFGPKGYQPPAKLENSIFQNIGHLTSQNYLGAFLPGAIKQAAQIYGPEVAAQLMSAMTQQNTIKQINTAANQALEGTIPAISNDFNNSIGLQRTIDQGIRSGLASMNPGNANLLSPDAPLKQTDEIQNQETTSFRGGGQVVGAQGDLNASSLAAQRASALAGARQLPFLNTISGRQALVANMMGSNSALAKLQTAEGSAAQKIASEDLSANNKTLNSQQSLYKTLTGTDAKYIAMQIGIDKTNAGIANTTSKINASEDTRVAIANASHALEAVRASTSARNAFINQQRYALELTKAAYPKLSTTAAASQAKSAQSFFSGVSGSKVSTYTYTDPATGKSATKILHPSSYEDGVRQWVATHGGTVEQAEAYANGFYAIGQNGRPFDPGMVAALHAAGVDTQLHLGQSPNGPQALLTTEQMAALAKGGYKDFVGSVMQTQIGNTPLAIPVQDAIKEGIPVPKGTPANGTIYVWQVKPYHADVPTSNSNAATN